MREAYVNSRIADDIEEEIGGRCIKLSDKVSLGLPDTLHIKDGIITFIEFKIGDKHETINNIVSVKPWDSVNDIRQYEICRSLAKNCLVLYMIYYKEIKMTAILPVEILNLYNPRYASPAITLDGNKYLVNGYGIEKLKEMMQENRRKIREKL